jgi:hypothetical protein
MLRRLDFIYIPSKDVDADLAYYVETLGAEKVFNVSEMGTQVAMVRLGEGPRLLLAGHLEGEMPILIYLVEKLKKVKKELKARGWKLEQEVEIPHGPCCHVHGERWPALCDLELVRPEADQFLVR